MQSRFIMAVCGFTVMALATGMTYGQSYPVKPVRIVTVAAGSGTDLLARVLAKGMSAGLGQNVVVDNRGIVAIDIAAKADADGYTLLLYTSPLWLAPVFRSDVTWSIWRDFRPVISPTVAPNILVVSPSLPVKSVKELIALAKAKPGELNYASGSTAASAHLAAELFKHMAGANIVRINFRGTGPGLTALFSGEVQMMFPAAGSAIGHIKAGRMRALGVSTAQPSALVPGLPTLAASGLPGYASESHTGVFVPAGTSAKIIAVLQRTMAGTLNTPEVKKRLFGLGLEVVADTPAEFTAFINSEITRMQRLVKSAGLKE
jgi:tripartite-type tricarboxylate transporter receptor subunit TctC